MKTMKSFLNVLLFFSIVMHYPVTAQNPAIEWQKNYGGTHHDVAHSMQITSDGGFIMAGYTTSNDGMVTDNQGGHDFWVVKTNSTGDLEWQNALGGTGIEQAYSIIQTSDGGYIVAGETRSNDGHVGSNPYFGSTSYWIVKLNSAGTILWEKVYGGNGIDNVYDIIENTAGNYIVVGSTYSDDGDLNFNYGAQDLWVLALDASGDILWTAQYGGSGPDGATSIKQTPDDGYIITGYTSSYNGDVTNHYGWGDFWVLKLDNLGFLEWEKTYGGSGNDQAYDIILTNDGGYVVAGYTASDDIHVSHNNGDWDMWVIKIDANGALQWETTIGGSDSETARSVEQTSDGGFIVAGSTKSNDGDILLNQGAHDYLIAKLNNQGNLMWTKTLGGTYVDTAQEIKQTNDGGYIVAGRARSDDGDITDFYGSDDFWLVKLHPENLSVNNIESQGLILFPNPAQDQISINNTSNSDITQVEIYNLLGVKVDEITINSQEAVIDVSTLTTGTYFLRIYADGGVITKKVIKK